MNSIELMVNEHNNIKRMLAVIRKYCFKVLKINSIISKRVPKVYIKYGNVIKVKKYIA